MIGLDRSRHMWHCKRHRACSHIFSRPRRKMVPGKLRITAGCFFYALRTKTAPAPNCYWGGKTELQHSLQIQWVKKTAKHYSSYSVVYIYYLFFAVGTDFFFPATFLRLLSWHRWYSAGREKTTSATNRMLESFARLNSRSCHFAGHILSNLKE